MSEPLAETCASPREYDFPSYFSHGLIPTEEEKEKRDELNVNLPDTVIDCHVHASTEDTFDVDTMNDHTWGHMISTYPVTTVEQSQQISDIMLPEITIQKLRFAHAFRGIDHSGVNEYLAANSPEQDRVALFGLHETAEEIEYTLAEMDRTVYNGLKMYYASGQEPVYDLYEYFPEQILAKAEQIGMPIILHLPRSVEQSIYEIVDISTNFPGLSIVLAHIGVTWIDHAGIDKVFDVVSSHDRIKVDTSGVADPGVVEKALRHFGPYRVLFGTDEPLNLLREQAYDNPALGPRIITDYPYHWVDTDEYNEFVGQVPTPTYSHLQQIEAIVAALNVVSTNEAEKQKISQAIFYDNAKDVYGF